MPPTSFLAHVDASTQTFEAGMAGGQPGSMRQALHPFKGPVLFVKARSLPEQLGVMHEQVHAGRRVAGAEPGPSAFAGAGWT